MRPCSDSADGALRNDSAAACSSRTWRSIWARSTSIGTCGTRRPPGRAAAPRHGRRSAREPRRAARRPPAVNAASSPVGRPRVAAPNARPQTARPNTLMHSTIRNITMSRSPFCTGLEQVRCHPGHALDFRREFTQSERAGGRGLTGCQAGPASLSGRLTAGAAVRLRCAGIQRQSGPNMRIRLASSALSLAIGVTAGGGQRLAGWPRTSIPPTTSRPCWTRRKRAGARPGRTDPRRARAPDDRERPEPDRPDDRELRQPAARRQRDAPRPARRGALHRAARRRVRSDLRLDSPTCQACHRFPPEQREPSRVDRDAGRHGAAHGGARSATTRHATGATTRAEDQRHPDLRPRRDADSARR